VWSFGDGGHLVSGTTEAGKVVLVPERMPTPAGHIFPVPTRGIQDNCLVLGGLSNQVHSVLLRSHALLNFS
jgi:hypothetical protein